MARLFGLLTESSARGAEAMELLFVAPPNQYKNSSVSSRKCPGTAPPKSLFGAAPACPVRKRGTELKPELKQTAPVPATAPLAPFLRALVGPRMGMGRRGSTAG